MYKAILIAVFGFFLTNTILAAEEPISSADMSITLDFSTGEVVFDYIYSSEQTGDFLHEYWAIINNVEYRQGNGSWSNFLIPALNQYHTAEGTSSVVYPTYYSANSGNDILRATVKVSPNSTKFFDNATEFRVSFVWQQYRKPLPGFSGYTAAGNSSNKTYTYNTNPNLGAVQSLATNLDEYCDKVRLTWQDGTGTENLAVTRVDVSRKEVGSDSAATTIGTAVFRDYFDDTTAIPGVKYKYYVKNYLGIGFDILFNSFQTKIDAGVDSVQGRKFGPPANPSGLFLDQASCSGDLDVNWNWKSSTNAENFIIVRADDSLFTLNADTAEVSGGDRDYRDGDPISRQRYYYKVLAKNTCPVDTALKLYSKATEVETGIGLGVPRSTRITNLIIDTTQKAVTIQWDDNSFIEDGFKILREGNGTQVEFEANADTNSYTDKSASVCVNYTYKVKTYNTCKTNGVVSKNDTVLALPADVSLTFDATNGIEASDGEFGDRIELKWKTDNRQNEDWYIVRIDPSIPDTVQISTVDGKQKRYIDNTSNANVFYEYQIYGETDCAGNILKSNIAKDYGFKLAYGTINGQITYAGGTAVKGVKVIARASSGASGKSLNFKSAQTRKAVVKANSKLNSKGFSVQGYAYLNDSISNSTILSKVNAANGGWRLYIENESLVLSLDNSPASAFNKIEQAIPNFRKDKWISVGAIVGSDSIKLFADGKEIKTVVSDTLGFNSANLDLVIGHNANKNFNGGIDELRFFNRALTTKEFKESFNVFINPSMSGLVGYWRFDEGFGSVAYDYSKTNLTSNRNHASIHGAIFDSSIPTESQLSSGAYTDSLGSYFIPFVPYQGTGDNFIISPSFGTHSFNPATTTLFVGANNPNHTGVNFEDKSAFKVRGSVKYKNTSCFVEDVFIKVDGEVQVQNGTPVTTGDSGSFTVSVPIGRHVVSIEKNGHDFSLGSFPKSGNFDFQDSVTLSPFIDSTLIKVVGRVAGGGEQAALLPNLGRGNNNIGKATIAFEAKSGACLSKSVLTNDSTGEYQIFLPPMKYDVLDFNITNNAVIKFQNNTVLDLSNSPGLQTIIDTVFTDTTKFKQIVRIDSTDYNLQRDFIYYALPVIGVANPFGEDSILFVEAGVETLIPSDTVNSDYPIFKENINYTWSITAFEEYKNLDDPSNVIIDSVAVKNGEIKIKNNLATLVDKVFEIEPTDNFNGIQEYTFTAGQARTTQDSNEPRNSFTKSFELTLKTPNHTIAWKPNANNGITGDDLLGIIFGGRALGNSFATTGPQVVTMILRDPPGSQSFASWESGRTVTTTTSWSNEVAAGARINSKISLGVAFSVGLGYSTKTKITNSLLNNVESETSVNLSGEHVEKTTRTVTLSTGNLPDYVGSASDLYYGKSMNMDFGLAEVIGLIKLSNCGGGNSNCLGDIISFNGQQFKLGTTRTMFVVPGGYGTEFIYTEDAIINNVIPKLEALRNQLLADVSLYNPVLPATDPNFGKNNDDLVFGAQATPLPGVNTVHDSSGISYSFLGYTTKMVQTEVYIGAIPQTTSVPVTTGVDSVWWYNQQIKLWKNEIAKNEEEKIKIKNKDRNLSYQGGATYTNSTTVSRDTTSSTLVNFSLSNEMAAKIGASIGGAGVSVETGVTLRYNHNTNKSTTTNSTSTFAYTILDTDNDDAFTVDIFKSKDGFGPIFKTRGGETSCPYQGQEVTKFYNPGTEINKATVQLEQPGITVSPSELLNVPAEASANFTLGLENAGPVDAVYSFKVLESSNPHGAIIKIDGIDPNRDFAVPANTVVTKTLTVEKGPGHIRFENIGIVFHSRCQFSFGTDIQEDIADTAYFTVNYLPSCTELEIIDPSNQFVFNNSFAADELDINISGYNINYDGLDKIGFQYKPTSRSSWSTIETEWFRDTSGIDTIHPNHLDPLAIPQGSSYIPYKLDMSQEDDQNYNLRAFSSCKINGYPDKVVYSNVITGIADRIDPHPFGSPSPADGVLDPNDDISIKFNEPIKGGSLTMDNFQITGVVNGQEIRHSKTIGFDGNNDFLEIQNGFEFTNTDFTLEFWAKRNELNKAQVVISQGSSIQNYFEVAFSPNNKLQVQLGSQKDSSSFVLLDDSTWHHYSVSYNSSTSVLELIDRSTSNIKTSINNNFISTHKPGGKTFIGKSSILPNSNFNGSIHELRIWNKYFSDSEITSRASISLSGREAGLIGYWKMDEGRGVLTQDAARSRNAAVSASWEINPKGSAILFDGLSDYLEFSNPGKFALVKESDFTIEFWFKTPGGKLQSFFSNGSGLEDSADVNKNGWSIEMTSNNKIIVRNNGQLFEAVSSDFADNDWHHFALVVNRLTNVSSFVDGVEQSTVSSDGFHGFGGDQLTLGCRNFNNGSLVFKDRYFNGLLDEFRIWNSARIRENIEQEQYNRLNGNEFGLLAYYPFETYQETQQGPVLQSSIKSGIIDTLDALINYGTNYSQVTPTISLPRQTKLIFSTFSVNNDEIVITPTASASSIENVALNISVKDVKDLNGNVMQFTKSWIAYVNKNQVLWQDAQKNLNKEFNDTLSFTTTIVNQGGELKNYTISNIPAWLSVNSSTGTIDPLSTVTVRFTVNSGLNIGEYAEDIMLTTDFGFNEKLLVKLKVKKTPPDFSFDANLYQNSMSIIGQIRINGKISSNGDDYIIAYIGDSRRGVAKLQYLENYDKYYAFLDVYSNRIDSIRFEVWNSEKGEIHIDVIPNLLFTTNQLVGSPSQPEIFDVEDKVQMDIVLNQGWNWVSFPLESESLLNLNLLFKDLNLSDGDLVKTIGRNSTSQYGIGIGWMGRLSRQGLKINSSYLIKVSNPDTLRIKGFIVDPDTVPITVVPGWNRIGFVSQKNMLINTALSNYNATEGDVLKSQQKFAYYDDQLGWIGSLLVLQPAEGLLLKTTDSVSFVYPRTGLLRLKNQSIDAEIYENQPIIGVSNLTLNTSEFEDNSSAIIELDICEELINHEDFGLAAFYKNELRGWVPEATILEQDQSHRYFMTLYGEGEEVFDFKLINSKTLEEFDLIGNVQFEKDKVEGTPAQPLHFYSLKEIDCSKYETTALIEPQLGGHLYPNPFTNELRIDIPSEFENEVVISLIDELGRVIHSEKIMDKKSIVWTTDNSNVSKLRPGIYYIQFKSDEKVITEKVIKI